VIQVENAVADGDEIDIQALPAGVFLVELRAKDAVAVKRLHVIH
jgi:hypothetical protein